MEYHNIKIDLLNVPEDKAFELIRYLMEFDFSFEQFWGEDDEY